MGCRPCSLARLTHRPGRGRNIHPWTPRRRAVTTPSSRRLTARVMIVSASANSPCRIFSRACPIITRMLFGSITAARSALQGGQSARSVR